MNRYCLVCCTKLKLEEYEVCEHCRPRYEEQVKKFKDDSSKAPSNKEWWTKSDKCEELSFIYYDYETGRWCSDS